MGTKISELPLKNLNFCQTAFTFSKLLFLPASHPCFKSVAQDIFNRDSSQAWCYTVVPN